MKENVKLKVDWCSYTAAKYACEHWHYSGCVPVGKLVKIGVWEDNKYIGCVLFGRGASPFLKNKYSLEQTECCELVRVALAKHKTEVSRIVSLALKILKTEMEGLRLVISFADPEHGHKGGIYQAGNWFYTGDSLQTRMWNINGKRMYERSVGAKYGTTIPKKVKIFCPSLVIEIDKGKHRYLMPLDKKMRRAIIKLAKPYPKKTCPEGVTGSTTGVQPDGTGSSPVSGYIKNPGDKE